MQNVTGWERTTVYTVRGGVNKFVDMSETKKLRLKRPFYRVDKVSFLVYTV